jgi:hypothetical protein
MNERRKEGILANDLMATEFVSKRLRSKKMENRFYPYRTMTHRPMCVMAG